MPDDRTTVTELATALGLMGHATVADAVAGRPPELRVPPEAWLRLAQLHASGRFNEDFDRAFENGRAFLAASDGLRGRRPRLVEWTGGRRPPGDEVAPIDLQVDHVYLISCKYLSANIANTSPARLFDGLLATTGNWDRGDWYATVAPLQYQALYDECRTVTGLAGLPAAVQALDKTGRMSLRRSLPGRGRYPTPEALTAYRALASEVASASAERWKASLARIPYETMMWRLLRIGNAPYFILGADSRQPLRLRVMRPWDWRQRFRLITMAVVPVDAGQPRVDWSATYRVVANGETRAIRGHVEIRWSHGPFKEPPEAKIYLDSAHDDVPGYVALGVE